MTKPAGEFSIQVRHLDGYAFRVEFDKKQYAELLTDEPAPLGGDDHPNPSRLLAAAIGNCLAASLLFCLKKSGQEAEGVDASVKVELVRNDARHLRIGRLDVTLTPKGAPAPALDKCREIFEDFCVVTQSVREGLTVDVRVEASS